MVAVFIIYERQVEVMLIVEQTCTRITDLAEGQLYSEVFVQACLAPLEFTNHHLSFMMDDVFR